MGFVRSVLGALVLVFATMAENRNFRNVVLRVPTAAALGLTDVTRAGLPVRQPPLAAPAPRSFKFRVAKLPVSHGSSGSKLLGPATRTGGSRNCSATEEG